MKKLLLDDSGSQSIESALWIILFVLGVAGAVSVLRGAVSNKISQMANQIKGLN